ncbi:MAG: hypothetical protein H0U76_06465 [Ktedonobacteraceae bacterium]|nr:hypothetical protein [Ktedonobacteraceae bacterium]
MLNRRRRDGARRRQERLRAKQQQVQVEQQRVKLQREREQQQFVSLQQQQRLAAPSSRSLQTRHLAPDAHHGHTTAGPVAPSSATAEHVVPGMPALPRAPIVRYRDIAHQVPRGQIPALVRADGSLLLTTWEKGYKIVLIVGNSSSGKTITAAGKIHERCRRVDDTWPASVLYLCSDVGV